MSDWVKVMVLSLLAAALFLGLSALLMALGIGPSAHAVAVGAAMTPERFESDFIPLARKAIVWNRFVFAPILVLLASLGYLWLVSRRAAIHGFALPIFLSLVIEYAPLPRLVMTLILGTLCSLLIRSASQRRGPSSGAESPRVHS